MKVLVTGGTGVIGTGLIPELIKAGHSARLLSRRPWEAESVEGIAADVSKTETLTGAADGCDAVVHIAGIVDESAELTFERINVEGTRNVLAEAERAGVRRFIFVSSLGAERGASEYHRSKARGEDLVKGANLDWTILRPGNVYGPGDEVISMLIKLVRALPAVPMVGDGQQPFQPIWFEDLGRGILKVLETDNFRGKTLELAGAETTNTRDIVERIGRITARSPKTLGMPAAVVAAAARLTEKFESIESLVEKAGLTIPITTNKLQMLIEGNVIGSENPNALTEVLNIVPTSLDEGLRRLANELPELLPEDGFGAMEQKMYEAAIEGASVDAAGLMAMVRGKVSEITPIEFSAEPGAPRRVESNERLTGAIPGRGHFQVRAADVEDCEFTLVTVEGHPLAGAVSFRARDLGRGKIRFVIEVSARAANVVDWVALKAVGASMQDANWREAVIRVVALSGGRMVGGIEETSREISKDEVAKISERLSDTVRSVPSR